MPELSRRKYIQGTVGALAVNRVGATPMRRKPQGDRGIQLAELFTPGDDHKIRLAAQIGITHAIVSVAGVLDRTPRQRYGEALRKIKADFQAAGLKIAGVESHPVSAEKAKLGAAGRDEEIENYIAAIQALAETGVNMICYNWMAGIGWYRTRVDLPGRGGALLTEFDNQAARKEGATE
jgi:mannonate dehydratase